MKKYLMTQCVSRERFLEKSGSTWLKREHSLIHAGFVKNKLILL